MLQKIKSTLRFSLDGLKKNSSEEKKSLEAKSLSDELKEVFYYWCTATTAHGFYNVLTARHIVNQILWISLIIVSIFLCYNGAKRSIISYLNYEVTTNYMKSIESPSEFPAITICNLNPFDLTSNNTGEFIKSILTSSNIDCKVSLDDDESGLEVITELSNTLKANIVSQLLEITNINERNEKLKSLGFSLDKMLISCFYNGRNCSAANFTWFKTFEYGNCYTFNFHVDNNGNPTIPLKTSQAGFGTGLNLEIFVGNQGKQDFYTIKSGIYVAVHNRNRLPFVRYEGFTVPTGLATNIAVTRTWYSRKPTPKSNCVNAKQVDSRRFNNSKLCYEFCIQEHLILPVCNCSDPIMAFYEDLTSDIKLCRNHQELNCVQDQKDLIEQNEEQEQVKRNCSQRCPLDCDSFFFESTISASDYPTEYYKNILLQHDLIRESMTLQYQYDPEKINANQTKIKVLKTKKKKSKPKKTYKIPKLNQTSFDLKNNVLMITVYYSSLYKTVIQETELVTFETLVGIIGGQLGLCIGISFLSLAETCEMVLSLIKVAIVYTFKKIFYK